VAVTHDHEVLDRFERVVDFKEFQEYGSEGNGAGAAGARSENGAIEEQTGSGLS
jgi:hypothetical protein